MPLFNLRHLWASKGYLYRIVRFRVLYGPFCTSFPEKTGSSTVTCLTTGSGFEGLGIFGALAPLHCWPPSGLMFLFFLLDSDVMIIPPCVKRLILGRYCLDNCEYHTPFFFRVPPLALIP